MKNEFQSLLAQETQPVRQGQHPFPLRLHKNYFHIKKDKVNLIFHKNCQDITSICTKLRTRTFQAHIMKRTFKFFHFNVTFGHNQNRTREPQ